MLNRSLLLLAALPSLAGAQIASATRDDHTSAPVARAARVDGAIDVDGRLTEAVWSTAEPITSFTQLDPLEGRPASQRTVVRIAYDDEAVYVGAMLYDTGAVTLRVGRRDSDLDDSDAFGVTFDSYHDHQTAFRFAVNASGVQLDNTLSGGDDEDNSWNPVWDAAVAVVDSGWVAEMRIPFSQLRFRPGAEQRWGLQLERIIAREQEYVVHAFTPKDERGGPSRYAHLDGIRARAGANRLELLPYMVAGADYRPVTLDPDAGFGNPYRDGSDYQAGFGGDLKFRLSSNFTLDATVNPDFGQVEADPAQINLTAFETRLDERRPFFVEGAEIFRFGSNMNRHVHMVYSRRVGREPQGNPPSAAVYADVPDAATILGAAKITGKTSNGWSVGVMEAVTGRETVPFVDAERNELRAVVEPLSNYFVSRARYGSPDGTRAYGALLTTVNRRLDDAELAGLLRSSGLVTGADFRQDWANRAYSFSAELSTSHVRGSPEAMVRTQRSSARYFQRPDATHLELDPDATTLAGYHSFVAVGKYAGDWRGNIAGYVLSPGYEINDMGFLTTADRRGVGAELSYRETAPGRVLREWDAAVEGELAWNHAGDRVGTGMRAELDATLLNYWNAELFGEYGPGHMDDRLTRGGPMARRPGNRAVGAGLVSNENLPLSVWTSFGRGWDAAGGTEIEADVGVTWKPASNVQLSVGPSYARERASAQYVTTIADETATATYGRRYVFAPLDQSELSMSLRANVAFTPKLTVETYLEPFVASGDYGALMQLRAPRTYDFEVYGTDAGTASRDDEGVYTVDADGDGPAAAFTIDDEDYTYRSLRGSAVLRWEWRRGSTLFLVWQQARALERTATGAFGRDDRIGQFDPVRETRGLFAIPPQNVLQVKVTYWLNP